MILHPGSIYGFEMYGKTTQCTNQQLNSKPNSIASYKQVSSPSLDDQQLGENLSTTHNT